MRKESQWAYDWLMDMPDAYENLLDGFMDKFFEYLGSIEQGSTKLCEMDAKLMSAYTDYKSGNSADTWYGGATKPATAGQRAAEFFSLSNTAWRDMGECLFDKVCISKTKFSKCTWDGAATVAATDTSIGTWPVPTPGSSAYLVCSVKGCRNITGNDAEGALGKAGNGFMWTNGKGRANKDDDALDKQRTDLWGAEPDDLTSAAGIKSAVDGSATGS